MFQEQSNYSLLVSAIWVSCDKIDNLSMAMGHVLLWPSSFDLVSTSGVFTQTPSSSYSKYYFGRPGKGSTSIIVCVYSTLIYKTLK